MNITTVQVYDSWAPAGLAGDTVKIDASEILGTTKGAADLLTTTGANSVYLKLDAPQVAIADTDIIGVYPAGGSTTSPDEYLPNIALARYTLPWERVGPAPGKPWLALILFKASDLFDPSRTLSTIGALQAVGLATQTVSTETVRTAVVTEKFVGSTQPTGPGSPQPPILTQPAVPVSTGTALLQIPVSKIQSADPTGYKQLTDATTGCGIDPATQVNALYLPNSVWKTIQPALADISLLCHVRMGSNDSAFGVIICNRLPGLPAQAGAAAGQFGQHGLLSRTTPPLPHPRPRKRLRRPLRPAGLRYRTGWNPAGLLIRLRFRTRAPHRS
jgi:hypothetical protein